MRLLLTVVALWGLLENGHPAVDIPKNQDNIVSCIHTCYPHDCSDVYAQGLIADGVYLIYPGGASSPPVPVYCDMTSTGGPWTVFQKRSDGSVNFYRGWEDYKMGFGRASGEFWMGLRNIWLLTQMRSYKLRIDMADFDKETRHVTYDSFSISPLAINPEEDGYKLHVDGFKEGDPKKPAGNSLIHHNGMNFSTYDHDRDMDLYNCAEAYRGGFWYISCHHTNPNGKYLSGVTEEYATGIVWHTWKAFYYSLQRFEMKITPTQSEE